MSGVIDDIAIGPSLRESSTSWAGAPVDENPLQVADRAHQLFRLVRDSIFNNTSVLLLGLISLVLVPWMLRALGTEAYGTWVAAVSLSATIALLDFGLSWSLIAEVSKAPERSGRMVSAVGAAFVGVGMVGAIVLALTGWIAPAALHVSTGLRSATQSAFALLAIAFFCEQISAFFIGTLQGLRRFDVTAAILTLTGLLRAIGVMGALLWRPNLVTVAAATAAASAMACAGAAAFARKHAPPHLPLFAWKLDLQQLRSVLGFGISSQLMLAAYTLLWQAPTFLIGTLLGSAAIVPFHLGQKFPAVVQGINGRAAEVMFPAASEQRNDRARSRHLLEDGTRWILVTSAPVLLLLAWFAEPLLRAWIGEVPAGAALVFQLMALAVVADAIGLVALHQLWGQGDVRVVRRVMIGALVLSVVLTWVLLRFLGVAGVSLALALAASGASVSLLVMAAHRCGTNAGAVLKYASAGVPFPLAATAVAAWAVSHESSPASGWALAASGAAGLIFFALIFLSWGALPAERRLLRVAYAEFRSWLRPYLPMAWRRVYWRLALALDLISALDRSSWRNLRKSSADSWILFRAKNLSMISVPGLKTLLTMVETVSREDIPGDIVECGVCNGGSALVLAQAVIRTHRELWLFDSFRGLPAPTTIDGPEAEEFAGKLVGNAAGVLEAVQRCGVPIERVHIVPGWFSETLPTASIERIAFLHVDADFYEPILLCLERFYDSVSEGGFIVLDDYYDWPGCKAALDEFAHRRGLDIEVVPGPPAHFRKRGGWR